MSLTIIQKDQHKKVRLGDLPEQHAFLHDRVLYLKAPKFSHYHGCTGFRCDRIVSLRLYEDIPSHTMVIPVIAEIVWRYDDDQS